MKNLINGQNVTQSQKTPQPRRYWKFYRHESISER